MAKKKTKPEKEVKEESKEQVNNWILPPSGTIPLETNAGIVWLITIDSVIPPTREGSPFYICSGISKYMATYSEWANFRAALENFS